VSTPGLPRRLSVIVPTRDRPELLRQALASIRAVEAQDFSLEILVGDNGSLQETKDVAAEFGAVHLLAQGVGASAGRNAGLAAASGDYIAFLDDDDVWLSGHLRAHFDALDADPTIDGVLGQVIYADRDLNPSGPPSPAVHPGDGDEMLRKMLSGWFPQIGTLVVRKPAAQAAGLFDPKLLGGQDLDWMLRIARKRRLAMTMTPCVLYRGRPPGSYDALQRRRVGFDRQVFLRHALPEWRIWKSLHAFGSAYSLTLWHFYQYFIEAADDRARRGLRFDAAKAIFAAVSVFPLRGVYHAVKPGTPLNQAVRRALAPHVGASLRQEKS